MKIDFNSYADAYLRNRAVQPMVLRALVEECGLAPRDSVLEIGCGTANYLAAIAAETGAAGFGIDPAAVMLAQARSDPGKRNLTLQVAPAESLPFPEAAFRFAFSVDVIHHVGDRTAAAREAFRVLQSGGRLCIATDSHEDIANRVPLSSHFPETIPYELQRYPPIDAIVAELRDAGFDSVDVTHVSYDYPLTDITPYFERAFSALRLISEDDVQSGLTRLEKDLHDGPIPARSLYTLIWATRAD